MNSLIPLTELSRRIKRFQQLLRDKGTDGALIMENADLYYFSGTIQNGFLFIPAEGEPLLLVKKDLERAKKESALKNIIPLDSMRNLMGLIKEYRHRVGRIGLELDVLPVKYFQRLQKVLEADTRDVSLEIRTIRAVKSAYEIQVIKETGTKHAEVFEKSRELIKVGMTDLQLAAEIEYLARQMGHLGIIRFRGFNLELFYGQILVGPAGAVPTFYDTPLGGTGLSPSFPQGVSGAVIEASQPISIDLAGNYYGYIIDQARVFSVGPVAKRLQEAMKTSLEIQEMLIGEAKAGAAGSDLYAKARQIVEKSGLKGHFMGYERPVSFIGHGVGLELNELPVIARDVEIDLKQGMVLALEPKFAFPGLGAVGIENTFVVTDQGLEKLSPGPDEIVELESK